MFQHSTHFLFNVHTFLLKPILAKTTPHLPLFFFSSFPVKTILLFNPTGSARGRLEREWAASALLLTHCSIPPHTHTPRPHPQPQLTDRHLAMPGKEERRKRGRERKKNNNHKRRNPHISHIIPAGESSCDSGIPLLV